MPNTLAGENIFRRDLVARTTTLLTPNSPSTTLIAVAISPDGRFIALGGSTNLLVWDMQSASVIYSNKTAALSVAISSTGGELAYATSTLITAVNLQTKQASTVSATLHVISHQNLAFSGDGSNLVYASFTGAQPNQVYCYNLPTATTTLISSAYNTFTGANANSDSPTISFDGRYIAYRSFASNIVPNDTNGATDLFLFDRSNSITSVVSVSLNGYFTANNRSLVPLFTPDASTLFFESWASDLAPGDFNQLGDVYGLSLAPANPLATFTASVMPPDFTGNPVITFPAPAGHNYQVQFKNNLSDSTWQTVGGSITVEGGQGYVTDPAPSATQRFYRVVAY